MNWREDAPTPLPPPKMRESQRALLLLLGGIPFQAVFQGALDGDGRMASYTYLTLT